MTEQSANSGFDFNQPGQGAAKEKARSRPGADVQIRS